MTGAAKRIGRAIALDLAGRGMGVVVHYGGSADEARELVREIEAAGGRAWAAQADLADRQAAAELAGTARELAGRLDVLVNNASMFPKSTVLDFEPEELFANVDVNALAPLLLSRALARQQGEAAIVNLLDTRIVSYDREHAAYHLSKRMLHTITRMLALELAPRIRVNAVAPGVILPPPGKDEAYLEELRHTNPLNSIGDPADIARAAAYLLEAPFVTGQVVYVDGGRHMLGGAYA